ncbi:MAG: DnaJ domain-containing protein [Pseudomonadota bacterium]|nr:DnaJ domain-containing protein [Pseudomonadota bacterium]
MEYKDYYKILGVEREANADQIKSAYRKLARQFHPDINKAKGSEERFKEISEAHEVLKDPEKRAAYDQVGKGFRPGEEFRPAPGWDAGFEFSGADQSAKGDFSDFFESLFGRARGGAGRSSGEFRARGQDHHARILIDLEDAYRGAARTIALRAAELGGDGQVQVRERQVNVSIPKGVRQGQFIRLAGQASPGIGGGPAGDLFLEVEFNPHSIYRIDGRDVYLDLPVAPWEAALGSKVNAPTPAGTVSLTIPAGSGPGHRLRLRGRGIPAREAGDFYVVLQIALPPARSEEAQRLYREMQQKLAFNPRQHLGV